MVVPRRESPGRPWAGAPVCLLFVISFSEGRPFGNSVPKKDSGRRRNRPLDARTKVPEMSSPGTEPVSTSSRNGPATPVGPPFPGGFERTWVPEAPHVYYTDRRIFKCVVSQFRH